MEKITLIIADDHQLMRESLALILGNCPDVEVLELCASADSAVEAACRLNPDVVLLDINMPVITGIEAVPLLQKAAPKVRILGMSMHTHPAYAKRMIRSGAMGFVTKNSSCEELALAIREVHKGKRYLCSETKNILCEQEMESGADTSGWETLTAKELEVIEKIKAGLTSREIGRDLLISAKTVEVHRYNILRKLRLPNTAALVHYIHQYPHTL